jgi:hypothetical protein
MSEQALYYISFVTKIWNCVLAGQQCSLQKVFVDLDLN